MEVTSKPHTSAQHKPHAAKAKPHHKPHTETKPETGVITFKPEVIVVDPGKGQVKPKCEDTLSKGTCEALQHVQDTFGKTGKSASTFNSAALQRSMSLTGNSSAGEVFSAISSQTW
jgi:hypothetical protein